LAIDRMQGQHSRARDCGRACRIDGDDGPPPRAPPSRAIVISIDAVLSRPVANLLYFFLFYVMMPGDRNRRRASDAASARTFLFLPCHSRAAESRAGAALPVGGRQ